MTVDENHIKAMAASAILVINVFINDFFKHFFNLFYFSNRFLYLDLLTFGAIPYPVTSTWFTPNSKRATYSKQHHNINAIH